MELPMQARGEARTAGCQLEILSLLPLAVLPKPSPGSSAVGELRGPKQ